MLEPLVTLGVRCTTSEESGVQSVLVAFVGDWSILFRVFHCFDFFEFGTNVMSCSVSVNLQSITVQYIGYIISSHWIVNSELQNERAENVVARVPLMNYQTSVLCFQMQDSKTSCHVLSTGLGPESWLRLSHSMKVLFTTTWQMNSSCKAHMALQASDSMVRDGPWWSVMVRDGLCKEIEQKCIDHLLWLVVTHSPMDEICSLRPKLSQHIGKMGMPWRHSSLSFL